MVTEDEVVEDIREAIHEYQVSIDLVHPQAGLLNCWIVLTTE